MSDQKQRIQAFEEKYIPFGNYASIDFDYFYYTYSRNDTGFLNQNGITFTDYVGLYYFTSNDLLYYPMLAEKIRTVKEYPTLTSTYAVDRQMKGMAFVADFYYRMQKAFEAFQAELKEASWEVDRLIGLYGEERKIPIIESMEIHDPCPRMVDEKLMINGITWYIELGYAGESRDIRESINLRKLLGIPRDFLQVRLVDIVPGTPLLALRIGKTWGHKGQVIWYNLDTRQKMSTAEVKVAKAKHP